jgi:hypothetical protein
MKIPPAPESTRGWVSIGLFFSGVTMFVLMLKELSLDPCTEKIYIGGADVETVLSLKTQTVLLAFFFQNLLLFFTHRGDKGPDV